MPTNVRSLAVRREEGEWVASPARSSRRVAREISREVVAPRHRTFVMTPPEHLLDDAKAERVVIDDENPQSGREFRFILGFRHRRTRRGARHAEETLGEEALVAEKRESYPKKFPGIEPEYATASTSNARKGPAKMLSMPHARAGGPV